MIIFLFGEDTFRSRQKLYELREKFKKSDPSLINLLVIEGGSSEFSLATFRRSVESLPFFGKKRMVVLKNFLLENKSAEKEKSILEYLKKAQIPETTVLVFFESGSPDARKSLFKFLEKNAEHSFEFESLSEGALRSWIGHEIASRKIKISEQAKKWMISEIGPDLWRFTNELDKLAAFGNSQPVDLAAVKDLVSPSLEEDIFKMVDALGEKNRGLALKLVRHQKALGKAEPYLLAMMTFQFRNLILVSSSKQSDSGYPKAGRGLRLPAFVIRKIAGQLRLFSPDRLKIIYRKIEEVDLKIKTGLLEPEVALDLLILELTR